MLVEYEAIGYCEQGIEALASQNFLVTSTFKSLSELGVQVRAFSIM